MQTDYTAPSEVDRLRQRALVIGVVGLLLCGAGVVVVGFDRFLFSYLVAFIFWVGVALGCLAIAMLHQVSGGGWGVVIRRLLESATRTLPLMAVLFFVPVLLMLWLGQLGELYEWARPEAVAESHALQHKQPYLNVTFFLIRAVGYFVIWLTLAHFLNKWSLDQDRTGDQRVHTKLRTLSGPGLVLYVLTVSFASFDWVMSLDAEWFSTIFGVLFLGGQGLSALAFVIAVLVLLSGHEPLAGVVKASHLHDLGKLMLAFVMLWAYFNFSQLLIIWAGNLPEEIPWYLRRLQSNWKWVGLALVLFHFALPFMLLLSRDLKRHGRRLATVAMLVIVMRCADVVWLIAPEFHHAEAATRRLGVVLDLAAVVGLGGIWLWFFLSRLKSRPLLPLHDPNWEAS